MKLAVVVAAVAAVLLCASPANAALDFSRVHLVDSYTPAGSTHSNYLFRGNMPVNDTGFQYDTLLSYMRTRAAEKGLTLPPFVYMHVISFNTPFDKGFAEEQAFWQQASPKLGEFENWMLGVAGLLPPTFYPVDQRRKMANSTVWAVDQIPTRIAKLREYLTTAGDVPVAIYVHCSAGCDRTGEVVGTYRLKYQTQNLHLMYNLNCAECGRCPNYFSTTATEWYCFDYEYTTGVNLGDCMGFAKCTFFGHCQNVSAAVTVEPFLRDSVLAQVPFARSMLAGEREGNAVVRFPVGMRTDMIAEVAGSL